jgi:hypothetical protein
LHFGYALFVDVTAIDNLGEPHRPRRFSISRFFGGGATPGKGIEWFEDGVFDAAGKAALNVCPTEFHYLDAEQEPLEDAPAYPGHLFAACFVGRHWGRLRRKRRICQHSFLG